MLNHVVLLCFDESVSAIRADEIIQEVANLKFVIPQIKSFTAGVDCSIEGLSRGLTHGFVIQFDNEEDRDIYLFHPEHVRVAETVVKPNLRSAEAPIVVFDYKF